MGTVEELSIDELRHRGDSFSFMHATLDAIIMKKMNHLYNDAQLRL